MRRLPALVAALVAALLVLAGCGSDPGRVGAAAVVGDRVVPVDLVQERLVTAAPVLQAAVDERAVANGAAPGATIPPSVLANRSRALVSVAVQHELITAEAAREGITVPPDALEEAIGRSGGLESLSRSSGFDTATVRELLVDGLTLAEIGRRAAPRLAVTAEYVTLRDRAAAEAFLQRATAGPGPARVFAALPAGAGAAPRVLRPTQVTNPRAPGGSDSVTSVAYGLAPGSVALVAGGATGGDAEQPWTVVHVLDRRTDAPAPVGAPPADTAALAALGLRLLQLTSLEEGVTVNPRYGVWDPTQLAVVGSPAESGTIRAGATRAP